MAGVTKVAAIMAATVAEARAALAAHPVAGVVLDDWFPDGRGGELLGEIRTLYPGLPVLSIASELGVDQGLKADAEVPKAELVTSLVPRMRTMMRARASEAKLGRVLVVDDSRTYREQLRASLTAAGYEGDSGRDGRRGGALRVREEAGRDPGGLDAAGHQWGGGDSADSE